jgi:hypothetical protein
MLPVRQPGLHRILYTQLCVVLRVELVTMELWLVATPMHHVHNDTRMPGSLDHMDHVLYHVDEVPRLELYHAREMIVLL